MTPQATLPTTGRIPWLSQFAIGSGITAFTGSLASSAYGAVADPTGAGGYTSETEVISIESSEDVEQRLNADVSGSFNVYGVDVSGSASFLKDIKTSSKSSSFIVNYKSYRDVNVTDASLFKLTQGADALVQNASWSSFRKGYGDYYVSGYREEAEFVAVYTLTTQTSDDLLKVKAELSASRDDVFSASGSAAFKSTCAKNNATISVTLYERGTGAPGGTTVTGLQDPSIVVQAFSSFVANMSFQRTAALLTHHSNIIPALPKTVPGDPTVIADIANLFSTILYCNGMADDLPQAAQAAARLKLGNTLQSAVISGATLYDNDARRQALWQDITAWQAVIAVVLNYQIFSRKVALIWAAELPVVNALKDPGATYPNNNGTAPSGPTTWGLTGSQLTGVVINAQTQWTGHVPSAVPGWAQATLNFDMSGHTIVGFTITPSWTDGTDGYWCLNSGGVGSETANFAFRSQYDRGLDFSVTVYTVKSEDYHV